MDALSSLKVWNLEDSIQFWAFVAVVVERLYYYLNLIACYRSVCVSYSLLVHFW
jgi:hypothetical protein